MNLLKKILANPYLKKLMPYINWTLIGLLIIFFLICLLIFLIVKRRKKAKIIESAAKHEEEKEDFLEPACLLQIWKNFLTNIPSRFRRSILMYQPYIVMGEAGTGKTRLIDIYTDWQSQANQFYPSHTQDALLQIYLGTKIVVQEISAALLHDTSAPARKAFEKLWKTFKRKKDLIVVVTLKGDKLVDGTSDFLKEQAQIIRGKLNILSEILKRPAKVRIALTFMNHIRGFSEFSTFLYNHNMPFELEFNEQSNLDKLGDFIGSYEQYFSNALISEKSENFLKILSFCQTAPLVLSTLSKFIKTLTSSDPLSPSPRISRVFFTSETIKEEIPFSNPFKTDISIKKIRTYNPMRKHKIAAFSLVALGITYILFSYYYKQNYIKKTIASLNNINISILKNGEDKGKILYPITTRPVPSGYHRDRETLYTVPASDLDFSIKDGKTDGKIYNEAVALLNEMENQSDKILNDRLLLDFFPDAEGKIHAGILKVRQNIKKKIIQSIFEPKLVQLKINDNAYNKNLLVLALIYSSNSNRLGSLIKANIDLWSKSCNIPRHIIEAYLALSDSSWDKIIPVAGLIDNKLHMNTNKNIPWFIFLRNIEKIITQSFVSPMELENLQNKALNMIGEIHDFRKDSWFYKLRQMLGSCSVLGDAVMPVRTDLNFVKKDYMEFEKFLNFFRTLQLESLQVNDINLEQLFSNLNVMMELKKPKTQEFNFVINKQKFHFTSDELYDLITKSSIAMLLRNYVSYYDRFPGVSFFHQDSEYKDLVMDISLDHNFYFSKRAVINGRYTKKIYDREVMPVLKKFPGLLEKLPVSETDKTYFANFMFREVESYIHNYILSYENCYRRFRISADSVGELRYVLTQMTLPMNQFQEFFIILNNNLSLDYVDNPYFHIIKSRLKPFKFISLLMQTQKDEFPEFEKYKAILRQLLDDLVSTDPVAIDGSDSLGILKSKLSPVARIGLDVFLNGPESYLRMIQKWGTSTGIPEQWLYPFTEPVYQAYLLGQREIEKTIKKEWVYLKTGYVNPVIKKFPFNPEATSSVTPEDLKNLACSQGEFWKNFLGVIAPLCIKTPDGKWHERSFVMSSLKFPENMLKEVNYISHLSGIFFDEKAKPIPLVFEIKPHPLPLIENKLILVVLSYLRTGKTTVFGFNQQPIWHSCPIEWWKTQTASVGVEFMERGRKSKKMFSNIVVPNAYWSFYRLLKKAETPEPFTWMWSIESRGDVKWKRAISFSIKRDPWSIFNRTLLNSKK